MRMNPVICAVAGAAFLSACGEITEDIPSDVVPPEAGALTLAQHETICNADPRVQAGVVTRDICVGADIFFRETFNGNGRTCATCHRVEQNFTIDPAFIATLPNTDRLFIAEQVPALANLERPAQMRARGLILENVDGFGADPNVRFVLRSTPHNLSMGTSILTPTPGVGPAERTGWSADGAPFAGRLADFTNGAIGQHFTTNLNRALSAARAATEDEGQRVALFMRELGRKNELDITNQVRMQDGAAELGRQRFIAVGCNGCHRNAGANTGATVVNRNFNTGVEAARSAPLAGFPRDGGLGAIVLNPDGSIGDGTFNSTPLIEAADTGPFFHTETTISGAVSQNAPAANTLEQAVAFYSSPAFANSPSGAGAPLAINATDVVNIGRFLRGLNAIFNIQMASARAAGASRMGVVFNGNGTNVQRDSMKRLATLAIFEVDDAIAVLNAAQGGAMHADARAFLSEARAFLVSAAANNTFATRQTQLQQAFNKLDLADTAISANVLFNMGAGTLMD